MIALEGIVKRFGALTALDGVDLTVERGTVHAVVGENGAGKTTLMGVLGGIVAADAGTVSLDGEPVRIASVEDAYAHGIGMVHQHFRLFRRLTVAENVVMGREPRRRGGYDHAAAEALVDELGRAHGLRVDPRARVGELSVGDQQRVELLRALHRAADVLILDEPTAVLTPQEAEGLFGVMRELAGQGRTVLFISHKLREVLTVSDTVTVLRRGSVTGVRRASETDERELAGLMVGRAIESAYQAPDTPAGEPVLRLEALTARGLKPLDLEVSAGEIVGVAGVAGNGQTELAEAIAGLRPREGGTLTIAGRALSDATVAQRREAGLAHIPEDRYARGLAREATIAENLLMGTHRRRFRLDRRAMNARARELVEAFDVRAGDVGDRAATLSGGNAQKLVIARELAGEPAVVLACQPTRGVDIGAAEFVHAQLRAARDRGAGVLLISADLDELLALADRIVVLYEGALVGESRDEAELGLLMAGAHA
ncbi:ABC transporter ATP-binding protein [Solirubrobacter sp. CPCC 204708]|uniref:ABC transporter ATP-binding protein n=1 Tax=Solirubrobacter deserti TaxID=2282478 RepID=A0ABT4RL05_9ACTN|nr:ABC transporter ATP-binding protein [Solirubrobacter deserti]MBE2319035.1 ABC transporter ATP-binding protein [Solirubrobacter deserti]MDA0139241.1 ABC transporter ATP-binding protein [Solirubrobacter deserti]